MIKRFFKWFGHWQHKRYLKKMGWTQQQYERQTDPDCNRLGHDIRDDYYHGYPYVMIYDSAGPWNNRFGNWTTGVNQMNKWCDENCTDRWRDDIIEARTEGGRWKQGFAMGDQIMCVAFKNERDFVHYSLMWGM